MAYGCRECDGSMICKGCSYFEDKPMLEDYLGDGIYDGDEYYDIDGEIICKDNLERWAKEFLKKCEKDDF